MQNLGNKLTANGKTRRQQSVIYIDFSKFILSFENGYADQKRDDGLRFNK